MRYILLIILCAALCVSMIWAYSSHFDFEPLLAVVTSISAIGYWIYDYFNKTTDSGGQILHYSDKSPMEVKTDQSQSNNQTVNVEVNLGGSQDAKKDSKEDRSKEERSFTRQNSIDSYKLRTNILFIDDDKKFNVVKILKDSGWKKTKTIPDVKNLDMQAVKEADIYFVDINGVGKLLNCENEGLDIALMLKLKYPDKKVIIYSANKNSNSFHEAWDKCDFKLEKNALPYQFQALVEKYSTELFR